MDLNKKPILERPVDELAAPARLVVPMLQNSGAPALPCVQKGDRVALGQPIGTEPVQNAAGAVHDVPSCAVHSPVSGTVTDVVELDHPQVGKTRAVVLQNDGEDTPYPYNPVQNDPKHMTAEEILTRIRRTGLATGSGPRLPLWARLSRMAGAHIETLTVNAVETEPYLCVARKLMEENPEQLCDGLSALLKCVGCKDAVLAVGDDTDAEPDDVLKVASLMGLPLRVERVTRKYPSGNERFLFPLLTGRIFPAGTGPEASGMGFVEVEDCVATARAVRLFRPQITRAVTVAGSAVGSAQVLEVRLGTSIHDVLEHCTLAYEPERVVLGGPMCGSAIGDTRLPIVKATHAVLAVRATRRRAKPAVCIGCGRCVHVCPERLFPNLLAQNAIRGDMAACAALDLASCIECGSCSYICPGRMPLAELIKKARATYIAAR